GKKSSNCRPCQPLSQVRHGRTLLHVNSKGATLKVGKSCLICNGWTNVVNIHHHIQIARVAEAIIADVASRQKSVVLIVVDKRCSGSCAKASGPGSRRRRVANILCPEIVGGLVCRGR